MRVGLLVGCVLLGLWATACGDSPTGNDAPGVLGPAGGSVSLGSQARIEVPAGALSEEVLIRIVPVSTPADLQSEAAIGQAYRFEPVTQTFALPARISILVPPATLAGRSIDQVTLLRSTSDAGALAPAGEELGSITRSSDGIVSGITGRLGIFSAALSNRAPRADAGPDQNVSVGATVNLSGSGTDLDGDALTFSWAFVSRPAGSAAVVTNPAAPGASFVADVAGNYDVRLTVSDGLGGSDADIVRIVATIGGGNRAPTASAGPDLNSVVGMAVVLNGSGSSDPDGATLTFSWTFLSRPSGSGATIANSTGAVASFVPDVSGAYEVRLTVSDGQLSDSDDVQITAARQNRAPTLSLLAPDAVFVGSEVEIAAAVGDPDGDAVTVVFLLVDKPAGGGDLTQVGTVARFTGNVPGVYRIRVTATDAQGAATQSDIEVGVNPHVDGAYGVTVTADATSCRQGLQVRNGTLPVVQPSPGAVTLDLPAASDAFVDQAAGRLAGEGFFFSGTIRIRSGNSTNPFTGTIQGTILATGELSLQFNFAAPFSFCRIPGTIIGTRD